MRDRPDPQPRRGQGRGGHRGVHRTYQVEFWSGPLGEAGHAEADRVLDAPTKEARIGPWAAHLVGLGVRFLVGHRVTRLRTARGAVRATVVRTPSGALREIEADWFVCAVPAAQRYALSVPRCASWTTH